MVSWRSLQSCSVIGCRLGRLEQTTAEGLKIVLQLGDIKDQNVSTTRRINEATHEHALPVFIVVSIVSISSEVRTETLTWAKTGSVDQIEKTSDISAMSQNCQTFGW